MPPRPPDPYRDDRPSLVAEIERLQQEIGPRPRRRALWPAAALLAAHLGLRALLSPWLNGSSDALFWIAAVIAYAPLPLAAVFIVLALRRPKETLP